MICRLFECGLDLLHLRKPDASEYDCARLILTLPEKWRRRIVVHDHFDLCRRYGLYGIHLNRRNPVVPPFVDAGKGRFSVSASCHSVAEAAAKKSFADYVFLSPIFDSISKQGYSSAYSVVELERAAADGVIDRRVIALGGVTPERIPLLRRLNFGGAAFLGDVWNRAEQDDFDAHARLLAGMLHEVG